MFVNNLVLLDALYINNSGGKVLLDYLVQELEQSKINVFYLFDKRCINDYNYIPKDRKTYLKASLYNRYRFYKTNENRFFKVFCFGNIAPPIKLKSFVYTYFHQRIFLKIPSSFSTKQKLIFKLKSYLFIYFLKNTDYILLQTESIKEEFLKKNGSMRSNKILVVPFYENMPNLYSSKKKNSFLYVSSGSSHKNHDLLLEAFKLFYDTHKLGTLTVTLGREYINLHEKIQNLNKLGYPIHNIGFVPKQKLANYYSKTEYVIYPSLSESFGLGILEGLETNCKIVGSDLPFLHAVCDPTLSFNPYSVSEIAECFRIAVKTETTESNQKVFNEIDKLISILKNEKL